MWRAGPIWSQRLRCSVFGLQCLTLRVYSLMLRVECWVLNAFNVGGLVLNFNNEGFVWAGPVWSARLRSRGSPPPPGICQSGTQRERERSGFKVYHHDVSAQITKQHFRLFMSNDLRFKMKKCFEENLKFLCSIFFRNVVLRPFGMSLPDMGPELWKHILLPSFKVVARIRCRKHAPNLASKKSPWTPLIPPLGKFWI